LLRQQGAELTRVAITELPTNDTWCRDFGPITVLRRGRPCLLDFGFNGWGLKGRADLDNQVTRRLHAAGAFGRTPLESVGLILEGGSIDSDGTGTLLTTSECLLSPNRNPHLIRADIERELRNRFGLRRLLWLEHGALAGDDTDSHVDTLARFVSEDTIVHVACEDRRDPHYRPLKAMAAELRAFRTAAGRPYRLLPLPWPKAVYDEKQQRLPATYANFLVINGAVLMPTYRDPNDAAALAVLREAFPGRDVIGIYCRPIIWQHGSLHCLTMQFPAGVLP
jgi:agmatine deiminase